MSPAVKLLRVGGFAEPRPYIFTIRGRISEWRWDALGHAKLCGRGEC